MKPFTKIASIPAHGYLQAVSNDGRATVYQSDEQLQIHYFDDDGFISTSFNPGIGVQDVQQDYHEESSLHPHMLINVVDDRFVLFILTDEKKTIMRFDLHNYGEGQITVDKRQLSKPVFDIALHPYQDCLLTIIHDTMLITLQPSGISDYELTINQYSEATFLSASIKPTLKDNNLYIYIFYLQLRNEKQELKAYRLRENVFPSQYTHTDQLPVVSNTDKEYDYLERVGHNTFDGLFCIMTHDIDVDNNERYTFTYYFDEDLGYLYRETTPIVNEFFSTFVEGHEEMLMARYYVKDGDVLNMRIREICHVEYTTATAKISYFPDEDNCVEGYFDRVSSVIIGGQTYILALADHELTVYDRTLSKQVTVINGVNTFSTKADNMLILDTYGQVNYLQEEVDENGQDGEEDGGQISGEDPVEPNLLIGLIVMGVCTLVLIVVIVVLCVKRKGNKVEEPPVVLVPTANPYLSEEKTFPSQRKTNTKFSDPTNPTLNKIKQSAE